MAAYRSNRNEPAMGTGRRRSRFLDPNTLIDVNDVEMMRRFVTEYGKVIPARLTGVSAKQQRQIKRGIRRARNIGLLA